MSYTTTVYGTWCNLVNELESSPEDGLNGYLGGEDPAEYDMESIYVAYRNAIDEALPPSISLCGDQFIGPAYPEEGEFDGYPVDEHGEFSIKATIEGINLDMGSLYDRYSLYTLDSVGRWILKSKAADPGRVARATLSRLGVKAFTYRPHPDSGRPQAWYRVGDVRDALAARPGRGARTDKAGA